jgi:hypothetical protein
MYAACPTHLTINLITVVTFGEEYKHEDPHYVIFIHPPIPLRNYRQFIKDVLPLFFFYYFSVIYFLIILYWNYNLQCMPFICEV